MKVLQAVNANLKATNKVLEQGKEVLQADNATLKAAVGVLEQEKVKLHADSTTLTAAKEALEVSYARLVAQLAAVPVQEVSYTDICGPWAGERQGTAVQPLYVTL